MVPNISNVVLDLRVADSSLTDKAIFTLIDKIALEIGVNVVNKIVKISCPGYETQRNKLNWIQKICKKNKLTGDYIYENAFNESAIFGNAWNVDCINLGPGPSKRSHQKDEFLDTRYLCKIE